MSWDERPTEAQVRRIALWCSILHIREPLEEIVSTRREAREVIYRLRGQLRAKRRL